jgi:hypothetical protein
VLDLGAEVDARPAVHLDRPVALHSSMLASSEPADGTRPRRLRDPEALDRALDRLAELALLRA